MINSTDSHTGNTFLLRFLSIYKQTEGIEHIAPSMLAGPLLLLFFSPLLPLLVLRPKNDACDAILLKNDDDARDDGGDDDDGGGDGDDQQKRGTHNVAHAKSLPARLPPTPTTSQSTASLLDYSDARHQYSKSIHVRHRLHPSY